MGQAGVLDVADARDVNVVGAQSDRDPASCARAARRVEHGHGHRGMRGRGRGSFARKQIGTHGERREDCNARSQRASAYAPADAVHGARARTHVRARTRRVRSCAGQGGGSWSGHGGGGRRASWSAGRLRSRSWSDGGGRAARGE